MARLHSLTKLWLQRWFVGLWQCVQCGSANVLKNVRWAKNKKHRVGLSVGFLVFSIFRFSVLSQWFTFYFSTVVCLFTLGGNGLWYGVVREYEAITYQATPTFFYEPQTLAYH
jgi:hypothetical protein